MKNTFTLTILSFIILTFLTNDVFAIPAFARKYNMSCKTCHSPFPSLKAYGDEFAGNGFQLKDKDAPRYYVETGDEELSLIRDLPLALRFEGYVTYNIRNSDRTDFTAPWILKLLSGGAITKDIAYYFYFFFSERGEIAGIEDAFLMFNDLFSTELDFMIGQYQVSDPLFKRELRLTFDDYMIYIVRPGYSNINLTYDRGVMFNYGFDAGTNINVQILNGTGIGEATLFRSFDKDKYKNVFAAISQDIGEHFRLGVSGYYGNELIENPDTAYNATNELWMAGIDASASAGPLELNLQYVERRDKNPYVMFTPEEVQTRGGLAELIYRPSGDESKWYSVLLYNNVKSDDKLIEWESLAFHLGYLVRRNIRLVGEYSYNIHEKFGRIGAGFIAAF
ncbi:MAG: hypothetical protein OEM46_01785 [Ignavibacteria bacterium]|nr:hypothetical protein [Ignavibacteria bacterium]